MTHIHNLNLIVVNSVHMTSEKVGRVHATNVCITMKITFAGRSRKMEWLDSGFDRNEKGEVFIYWECNECGFGIIGNGLQKPVCKCPYCGKGPEDGCS